MPENQITAEYLYEYVFKRAEQEIATLLDLVGPGDEKYLVIREARQKLLDARPGRKTETKAKSVLSLHSTFIAPLQHRRAVSSPEGATRPEAEKIQEVCTYSGNIRCELPAGHAGKCVDYRLEAALGGPIENAAELLGRAGAEYYFQQLDKGIDQLNREANAVEKEEREKGRVEASPTRPHVEPTGLDFTGDWITEDGRKVTVVGPLAGGWIGVEDGTTLNHNWTANGLHATDQGLNLVESIRPGKNYK